jgi:hypothetical protein
MGSILGADGWLLTSKTTPSLRWNLFTILDLLKELEFSNSFPKPLLKYYYQFLSLFCNISNQCVFHLVQRGMDSGNPRRQEYRPVLQMGPENPKTKRYPLRYTVATVIAFYTCIHRGTVSNPNHMLS